MATTTAASQYKSNAIQTAPPVKIVAMLYERALLCLKHAGSAIEQRRTDLASRHLGRAQEIIMELLGALDHDKGGEVALNLERIYQFTLSQMSEAGIKKDPDALIEVRDVLEPLYEAWDELARR